MPPKRKTVTTKKYTINLQVDVPAAVIDAARLLPDKECNASMTQYLMKTHNISARKINWGGSKAPSKVKAADAKKQFLAPASAVPTESSSPMMYEEEDEFLMNDEF